MSQAFDIKEYMASGILEAYVLGDVNEAERAEVQSFAARYPEIRAELDAIENALGAYAQAHAAKPSAGLKEKVLTATREHHDIIDIGLLPDETRRDPRATLSWSIAASILLLISVGVNIYLFNHMAQAQDQANTLAAKDRVTDSTMKVMVAQYNIMTQDMLVLKDPMYKVIPLAGQKTTPDAKAMVCWCPGSKLVYFETEKMPEPPKGMQYQLWAIVDGKPVDEGMITMTQGLHKMKDVGNATAFAVTLEKEGGSDTPHGDMVVMGNI